MKDDDYQMIFEKALSNTLQLVTCCFYAYIVSEDGSLVDATEIRGDYIAGRGTFKHEKTMNYEADWLVRIDGSFFRYTGGDWRLLRGPDSHAHDPGYKLPALASVPVFE